VDAVQHTSIGSFLSLAWCLAVSPFFYNGAAAESKGLIVRPYKTALALIFSIFCEVLLNTFFKNSFIREVENLLFYYRGEKSSSSDFSTH
jgi:hypothetical protein